jgi:hypothetical protein
METVIRALLVIAALTFSGLARADECGTTTCYDITSEPLKEQMTRIMAVVTKGDCKNVTRIRKLSGDDPNILQTFDLLCDDAEGSQVYQLVHFPGAREYGVDKFTGKHMNQVIGFKY